MKMNTQHLLIGLLMMVVFASCNRPTAYFQPGTREHFVTKAMKPEPERRVEAPAPVVAVPSTPTEQVTQATAVIDQIDAMVRNDSKLAADKKVQKRLNRVRTLLATTSAGNKMTPTATNAPRKMNLLERMVVKKMNKKISKQLAPANPDKAMAITGVLALGAVLVLGGLLVTLLTTGTGVTIGVIMIIAGLVFLLIGLL